MDAAPSAPPATNDELLAPPPEYKANLPNPNFQRSRFTILGYYLNWLVFAFVLFQVLPIMNNTLSTGDVWPYSPPGRYLGREACEYELLDEWISNNFVSYELTFISCPGFFQQNGACEFTTQSGQYVYSCADEQNLENDFLPSYLCESMYAVPEFLDFTIPELINTGIQFYNRRKGWLTGEFAWGPQAGDCVACNAGCTGYSGYAFSDYNARRRTVVESDELEEYDYIFINATYDGCTVPVEDWTRDNSDLMSTSGCDEFVREAPPWYIMYGPLSEGKIYFWFWMQVVVGALFVMMFHSTSVDEEPSWGAHLFAVNPFIIIYATGALGPKRRLDVMETLVPVTNLAGVAGQLLAIWLEWPILGYTFTWISPGELQNLGQIYVSAGIGIAVLIGRVYLIISSCRGDGEVNVEAA